MARKRAAPKNKTRAKREDNRGRPPTYDPEIYPQAAKVLCAKGATIAEIATAFGVATSTIWQWKISKPAFFESCRLGGDEANARVERSLFERAVGYTHESVKIFMPAGADKPVYPPYKQRACAAEILAEQISGNAIRPLLPEPTIIEHASIEPSAIRPQQPAAPAPGVTTAGELRIHPPQAYDGADDERLARRRDASSQQPSNMQPMPGGAMPYLPCPGQLSARTHPAAADDERIAGDCPCGNAVRDHRHAEPAAKRMPCRNCVVMT